MMLNYASYCDETDLEEVLAIAARLPDHERERYEEDWITLIKNRVEQGVLNFLIARDEKVEKVVGWIFLQTKLNGDGSTGGSVLVDLDSRRRGLGMRLFSHLKEMNEALGANAMKAAVDMEDQASVAFLNKAGFVETGTDYEMDTPVTPNPEVVLEDIQIKEWQVENTAYAEEIANLHNLHFGERGVTTELSVEEVEQRRNDDARRVIVAISQSTDALQGYLDLFNNYYVTSIAVKRRYWGTRLAEALVTHAKNIAQTEGRPCLRSLVRSENAASLRLHKQSGAQLKATIGRFDLPLGSAEIK